MHLLQDIRHHAMALLPKLIEIRRHLHRNPELSFQEFETARYLGDRLRQLGIPFEEGVAGTGLVGYIRGKHPDKQSIALRADMDALPIDEENEDSFRSQHAGIMHACGHDVHMTCLLGAATLLESYKNQFEGTIKLIFQPGEEKSPGGAKLMIEEGVLTNPTVREIFGLHVDPSLPCGSLGFRPGKYMASADEIHIVIKGKGGHAALPHQCIDPIPIAAQVITAMQQVVARRNNPLTPSVLTFGKISGGHTTNVIPNEVTILGTFRTFDEKWRAEARDIIRSIATHTAAASGASASVTLPPGYPFLSNDPALTTQTIKHATDYVGHNHIYPLDYRMSSEDFAFYSQEIPACFFRLGTNQNHEAFCQPVHNAKFGIDEQALAVGAGVLAWIGLQQMQ